MGLIAAYTGEPGGADVIIPVAELLSRRGHEVRTLASGHATGRLRAAGVAPVELADPAREAPGLLGGMAPDYVITSATSLPWTDMTEKLLWRAAHLAGIPSLGIIDQWQNYALRFSGTRPEERLAYLPDHINCLNEIGRQEMIADGFPAERLLAFGHPSLSGSLRRYRAADPAASLHAIGIAPRDFKLRRTLLFVSEPIEEHFGRSRGYTQYEVLDQFLASALRFGRDARIIIKLHPKDDRSRYRDIAERYRAMMISWVQHELASPDCLVLSDRIFGMSSVMLIEAFLVGKVVSSLQPGLCAPDPFVLSRRGIVPLVTDLRDFDPFARVRTGEASFDVDFRSDEFASFIEGRMSAATPALVRKGVIEP